MNGKNEKDVIDMAELMKSKKGLFAGLATLGIAGVFASPTPLHVHAVAKDTGISSSTVSVNSSGEVTYGGDLATGSDGSSWTKLIAKYRFFIAGVSGVGAVSMILFFIMNFMKLGATSANPQERSRAIMGLVFSGLAAAGLGAVTFIVGIFFNALG